MKLRLTGRRWMATGSLTNVLISCDHTASSYTKDHNNQTTCVTCRFVDVRVLCTGQYHPSHGLSSTKVARLLPTTVTTPCTQVTADPGQLRPGLTWPLSAGRCHQNRCGHSRSSSTRALRGVPLTRSRPAGGCPLASQSMQRAAAVSVPPSLCANHIRTTTSCTPPWTDSLLSAMPTVVAPEATHC